MSMHKINTHQKFLSASHLCHWWPPWQVELDPSLWIQHNEPRKAPSLLTSLNLLWTHICPLTGQPGQRKGSRKGHSLFYVPNFNPPFRGITTNRHVHFLFDRKQKEPVWVTISMMVHCLISVIGGHFVWPDNFFPLFSRLQPQIDQIE